MTITISAAQAASLRARLDRLTTATNDLTSGAHRLLVHSVNVIADLADLTPGLDITAWSQVWLKAMADVENMEAERIAGRPFEAWARELKGSLAMLAGIIYRSLGDDQPEPSTIVATVPARNGMRGYQVHALRAGAPLPGGQHIADVKNYGSDSTLLAVDGNGRERYLNRHTEIRLLDSGVVTLVEPTYAGWASD